MSSDTNVDCVNATTDGSNGVTIVYKNATVFSVDQEFSIYGAFSVKDGIIQQVGTSGDVLRLAPRDAEVIDLQGRTVLPGLIDAHAHIGFQAHVRLCNPSLAGLMSVAEILDVIRAATQITAPTKWIVTSPIGDPPDHFGLPEALVEGRWPSVEELDRVAPDHRVYIPTPAAWPYPAILNSKAMRELGLPESSGNGVWCETDPESGQPTGAVHGLTFYNAKADVTRKALMVEQQATGAGFIDAKATETVFAAALSEILRQNLELGITAVYEGHMNSYIDVLESMRAEGRLFNHVVCTREVPAGLSSDDLDKWFAEIGEADNRKSPDNMLSVRGVTVSMDGAIQFGKAHMTEPYLNPYGEVDNGTSKFTVADLEEMAKLAIKHRVRLNLLAAGNAAINIVMEALRSVHSETSLNGLGWVVQHFQHPSRQDIKDLAHMDIVAQTYSHADFSKGAAIYRERLKGDYWKSVIPMRWWFDAGIPIAQGSDGAHVNPFFEIWSTLCRQDGRTGESLLADPKRVSRQEAVMSMSINGAIIMGLGDEIGSIEPGKNADFIVIDRNILECELDDIRETQVLATVFRGNVVSEKTGGWHLEQ